MSITSQNISNKWRTCKQFDCILLSMGWSSVWIFLVRWNEIIKSATTCNCRKHGPNRIKSFYVYIFNCYPDTWRSSEYYANNQKSYNCENIGMISYTVCECLGVQFWILIGRTWQLNQDCAPYKESWIRGIWPTLPLPPLKTYTFIVISLENS